MTDKSKIVQYANNIQAYMEKLERSQLTPKDAIRVWNLAELIIKEARKKK